MLPLPLSPLPPDSVGSRRSPSVHPGPSSLSCNLVHAALQCVCTHSRLSTVDLGISRSCSACCIPPGQHMSLVTPTQTGHCTVGHVRIPGHIHNTAPDRNICHSGNYIDLDSVRPRKRDAETNADDWNGSNWNLNLHCGSDSD